MKKKRSWMRHFKFVALACLILCVGLWLVGSRSFVGPSLIAMFASLALFFMSHALLKSFAFTLWVFTFVTVSMVYPKAFLTWGTFNLGILIVPLIQLIMFGMGTTLSVKDFTRVFKMPWAVMVGIVLQFSIMPVTGYLLATSFGFEPEIAAGVVLIGACPGGVASNLMTFLAGGDVALSVTMTSCSTLISPLMTPFLMQKLAGQFIEINFLQMMFGIMNMIIVPILAGLITNRILYGEHKAFRSGKVLAGIGSGCVALAWILFQYAPAKVFTYGDAFFQKDGIVVGFLLIGVVALAQLVIRTWLAGPERWMDRTLPIVSMVGICTIIAVITARSADKLVSVAPLLILAAVIHNFVGYTLGYWFARLARLNERACRTVAFEVGLQNGGMASGLAMNVLQSAPAALGPAIFGPWMNISGSVLATWWHRSAGKAE